MAKTKTTPTTDKRIACKVCGHRDYFLADHLMEAHDLTVTDYVKQFPGAETVASELMDLYRKEHGNPRRSGPPEPDELRVPFAGINLPVNTDVAEADCLPCPPHYRVPGFGELKRDIDHAIVMLARGRSMYIHGLPGSGKDALFHAASALCRIPAKIFTVRPDTDIEGWFFRRSFTDKGTYDEEGELLKALRDGYTTSTGRKIPYMVLVSDFDRADRAQAEMLRLITDSIQGRVQGPGGSVWPVFAGTRIVATGNSAGAGDTRGRCISSNPLDASLMDRFERKLEFHWMDWRDEQEIVKAKFPALCERAPDMLPMVGRCVEAIRKAVYDDDLYAEFSHRTLCSWMGHTEDLMLLQNEKKALGNLLKNGARAFIDGLPDEETRMACRRLMDPHLKGGMLNEGDTSHIQEDELVNF